jgi:flagellar M-ring protein FliF
MNQQIREFSERLSGFWRSVSTKNKFLYIGLFLFIVAALSTTIYLVTKPKYVPLYSNEMSQQEIGDIKAELDREGYTKYQLENNGTSISVPEKDASNLQVSLAAKGLPKTGTISFSEMTKNLQFGATDRQLDAMEREALQGQVADLLTHVNGVKSADVVISTPKENLFVQPDESDKASASVVIQLQPGYELEPKQIQTLYHLVSKSIPNLPKENIVMTDQDGNGLEDTSQQSTTGAADSFDQQRRIQHDVEADIQQSLQKMLGTIMGQNKVLIQTFVRLNFDQVKTKENLVQPVDPKTNEGIAISAEKISKTYSGQDAPSGTAGTGQTDVAGYAQTGNSQQNKSDDVESRINYEVNRITKDIVQSPYTIDDMTINVGVEPPNPKNPASLTTATKQNIQQILANVVRTALSGNPTLTDQYVQSRITVFPREFSGKQTTANSTGKASLMPPWWVFAAAAAGVILIAGIIFFVLRRRKQDDEEPVPFPVFEEVQLNQAFEDKEEEKIAIKQEIEQMAKQQPKEFVGHLRHWLTKD